MPSFTDMMRGATRTADRLRQALPRATRLMDALAGRLLPESAQAFMTSTAGMATVESAVARVFNKGLNLLSSHTLTEVKDKAAGLLRGIFGNRDQSAASALDKAAQAVVDQTITNVARERGAGRIEPAIMQLFTDYPSKIAESVQTALSLRTDRSMGGNAPARAELWREAIDRHVARSRDNLRNIASELVAGKISPTQFRERMAAEIRIMHIGAATLGAGGILNLSENHMSLLNRRIAQQMAYLDNFVRDVQNRQAQGIPLGNRDIARAGLYASAARVTASQAQRQFVTNQTRGESMERRVLGACEDHCADCESMAALGWQPVGSLPPIGDSECGQNCCCHFEYDDNSEDGSDIHTQIAQYFDANSEDDTERQVMINA